MFGGRSIGAPRRLPSGLALLLVPALINLSLGVLARLLYSRAQNLETEPRVIETTRLPQVFWIYLAGAALVAAGFADYPIIAYHLDLASVASGESIAIFYAVAMAVSGTGSLVLGQAARSLRVFRAGRPDDIDPALFVRSMSGASRRSAPLPLHLDLADAAGKMRHLCNAEHVQLGIGLASQLERSRQCPKGPSEPSLAMRILLYTPWARRTS
jgi:hypothetical protein